MARIEHRYLQVLLGLLSAVSVSHSYAISLREAVQFTVKTNPEALVRVRQRQQADQVVKRSFGEYFPTVDAIGKDGREESLNFSTNLQWAALHRTETDLTVTQNLFKGLGTFYTVRGNVSKVHSSEFSLKATKQDLGLSAIEVYLGVLRNKLLRKVAQENVKAHTKTFTLIGKRAHVGISSISERELAAGRLASAQAEYLTQVKDEEDAKTNYLQVVGLQPKNLQEPTNFVKDSDMKLMRAVVIALSNNPEIKKAQSDVNATINTYKASRSALYPSIDAVVTRFRGKNVGGIEGPEYSNLASLRVTWNVFRGGSDVATIREAAYKKLESQDEVMRVEREVVKNTVLAYNQLQTSIKTLPLFKRHMDKSAYVVAAYQKQFVAGKRTLFDVLNAQNEYYAAKREYITGRYNIILSRYTLLNRMGRLLAVFDIR